MGRAGEISEGTSETRLSAVRRRRRERDEGGWCILRTNGRRTLNLASSLNRAGIEAWTPSEIRQRRLPRSRSFREYSEAIVPSFVFVRACHIGEVLTALAMPVNPHPDFRLFQHAGRAPIIADGDMGELRHRERLAKAAHEAKQERARLTARKVLRRDVAVGSSVKLTEGAYAGVVGMVTKLAGAEVVLELNGSFPVKVASWLLVDADVENSPAPWSDAA